MLDLTSSRSTASGGTRDWAAVFAHSTYPSPPAVGPGVVNGGGYSDMTTYVAPSGATVFATGSMQFVWGLDDFVIAPGIRPLVQNPGRADHEERPRQVGAMKRGLLADGASRRPSRLKRYDFVDLTLRERLIVLPAKFFDFCFDLGWLYRFP
jgi:hypothetical protein